MLKRALKRSKSAISDTPESKAKKCKDIATEDVPLGVKSGKDDSEEALEGIVLGAETGLLDNLNKLSESKASEDKEGEGDATHKGKKPKPKPVWHDKDDEKISVQINEKERRHRYFIHNKEKTVDGEKYGQTLKHQFEKVAGTPTWARLSWEKKTKGKDEDEDSDTEVNEILQSTGNYLQSSESLPKGVIELKRCTDANEAQPTKKKLTSLEFHPTAQVMLTAGQDTYLNLFQVDGKQNAKIQSISLERYPIFTAHFSRAGHEVVLGSKHHSFYYYDMIAGKVVRVPFIKGLEATHMKNFEMSPDGEFITFLGHSGHIHFLSAKTKEYIDSVKMNGDVECIAYSKDGQTLYSHGDDGEVYVWDGQERRCRHRFTDDGCLRATAIAASPDGRYIATGSSSGVVNLYDESCLREKYPKPVKSVLNLTTAVTSLKFNPSSEILAIGSNDSDQAFRMLHLSSRTVFSNFPERRDAVRSPEAIDFSLNGGFLGIGNGSGRALLYRVKHYENY